INTLGAVLGSLASLLLLRRRKDLTDASAPRPITGSRRRTGIVCDLLIWALSCWTVCIVFPAFAAIRGDGTITAAEPSVVFIAAVQVRRPVLLGRSLRFLFGIGGYMLLSQWTFPLSGLLLFALVAASAVMVFTTRRHRGLACVVSGTEIDDVRARDTLAPG